MGFWVRRRARDIGAASQVTSLCKACPSTGELGENPSRGDGAQGTAVMGIHCSWSTAGEVGLDPVERFLISQSLCILSA